MKKIIAFMTSLVMCFALSAPVLAFEEYIMPEDETVTLIVEMEGDPVMASEKAAELGSGYLDTWAGKNRQKSVKAAQAQTMNLVRSEYEAEIGYTYSLLMNGFSVDVPKNAVKEIEAMPGVKKVYVTREMQLHLGSSVELAGAMPEDTADSLLPEGYTGKGQVIAIIDSEFDTDHEMFRTEPENPKLTEADMDSFVEGYEARNVIPAGTKVYKSAKIPFAYDYVGKTINTLSTVGFHGTHVAGIAGGSGGRYPDNTQYSNIAEIDTFSGVAPDAQLVLMKTGTASGGIDMSAAYKAMEDAVSLGVCAINMSFGLLRDSPELDTLFGSVLNNARACGITVCVSVGNAGLGYTGMSGGASGSANVKHPDYSTSGTPAGYGNCMAVAAAVNGTILESGYTLKENAEGATVAQYSSYGVNSSLELKPEISAPGGYIVSSWSKNGGSTSKVKYQTISDDGTQSRYARDSGTSMAAPHLTGIAALMNEYLDVHGINLTGNERVARIENMLMSTAEVMYHKDNTALPYSPRAQGAGLVNTAAAMQTPVIAYGSDGKTKLSLKDKLSDSISFSFTLENLTSQPVTYNNLSLTVLTDGFVENNGKYYAIPGLTALLDSSDSIMPESVTVPAYGTESVPVTVRLDSAELLENSKIFTEGFFIDGFVGLSKSDGTVPRIGIPFTGFYGSWDKSSVFDTAMYESGGSELYRVSGLQSLATYFITDTITSGRYTYIVNGSNRQGQFARDYAAFSPNGDDCGDFIGINTAFWREIENMKMYIKNTDTGRTVSNISGVDERYPKFTQFAAGVDGNEITSFRNGNYSLVITGNLNYDGARTETFEIPFVIDLTKPEIKSAVMSGSTLTVEVSDNHYLDYIYLKSGSMIVKGKYVNAARGQTMKTTFDLTGLDADLLTLELGDYAQNKEAQPLVNCLGNFQASMPRCIKDSVGCETIFTLKNAGGSAVSGKLVAAYYGENSELLSTCMTDILLNTQASDNYEFNPTGAEQAVTVKLFIWDSIAGMKPLDGIKKFDLTW